MKSNSIPPVTNVVILRKSKFFKASPNENKVSDAPPAKKVTKSLSNCNTVPIAPSFSISNFVSKNFCTPVRAFKNLPEIHLVPVCKEAITPENSAFAFLAKNSSGLSTVINVCTNSATFVTTVPTAFLINTAATFTPNKAY